MAIHVMLNLVHVISVIMDFMEENVQQNVLSTVQIRHVILQVVTAFLVKASGMEINVQ